MSGEIDPVQYGKLSERVEHIDSRLESMSTKVDTMHDMLMRTQGGWKIIVIVGGFFAAFGATLTKVVMWWNDHITK